MCEATSETGFGLLLISICAVKNNKIDSVITAALVNLWQILFIFPQKIYLDNFVVFPTRNYTRLTGMENFLLVKVAINETISQWIIFFPPSEIARPIFNYS